jgi:hypothetical protein
VSAQKNRGVFWRTRRGIKTINLPTIATVESLANRAGCDPAQGSRRNSSKPTL